MAAERAAAEDGHPRLTTTVAAPPERALTTSFRYCGKEGHWACECRKKKRDEAAKLAKAGNVDESMLMLTTADVNASTAP